MDVPAKPRSLGLDIARGTAVILMVVYHMCCWPVGPVNRALTSVCFALTAFRMPVLFLISGFLAAGVVHKPKRQALARISNLIWLYLLWLPVMLLTFPEGPRFDLVHILENVWRPWTELWFIWSLALLISSLFLIQQIQARTVLLASLVIATADYSGILGLTENYDHLLRYAPMFYIGALYRKEITILVHSKFTIPTAAIIVLAVGVIHLAGEYFRQTQGWQLLGGIERIAVCVAAIYLLKPLEAVPAIAGRLALVGQKTLPIYLVHLPLWIVLRPAMPNLGGVATPVVSAALLVATSLLMHHAATKMQYKGMNWLFEQPLWWSSWIAQLASRTVWTIDRRYSTR